MAFVEFVDTYLAAVNIAGLKERNLALGYAVGDRDLRELDALFSELGIGVVKPSSETILVEAPSVAVLEQMVEEFRRDDVISYGYRCLAHSQGTSIDIAVTRPTRVRRAVRAVYGVCAARSSSVRSELFEELASAVSLAEVDALTLVPVVETERQPWQVVESPGALDPACPFCQSKAGENDQWSGLPFGMPGSCADCGATLHFFLHSPTTFVNAPGATLS